MEENSTNQNLLKVKKLMNVINENFPGETIATSDFLKEYGDYYEMSHVKNTRQPSLILKKIKF